MRDQSFADFCKQQGVSHCDLTDADDDGSIFDDPYVKGIGLFVKWIIYLLLGIIFAAYLTNNFWLS